MAKRSFAEEVGKELTIKAVVWGPAIAGGLLLGPVGLFAGLAASVIVLASGSGGSPPVGGDQKRQ